MKTMRTILFAIAVLVLLALPGVLIPSGAAKADEPFPCDPTPTQVRKCELRGGTFDYGQCKCVFP